MMLGSWNSMAKVGGPNIDLERVASAEQREGSSVRVRSDLN